MSEPIKQPPAPGDPAIGVQGGDEAVASKQRASNWDYADGFMMGLEDRGWRRLDSDLEDDIREQVDSLMEKLDVAGMEVRIGSLERALARVEGERDQQLRRVAELERERDQLRELVPVALDATVRRKHRDPYWHPIEESCTESRDEAALGKEADCG